MPDDKSYPETSSLGLLITMPEPRQHILVSAEMDQARSGALLTWAGPKSVLSPVPDSEGCTTALRNRTAAPTGTRDDTRDHGCAGRAGTVLCSPLVPDTTRNQGPAITALIIVIQLITGFDFSVNIYSAVTYAPWHRVLLPKSELHGRCTQHLSTSQSFSLINSTTNKSLVFRGN